MFRLTEGYLTPSCQKNMIPAALKELENEYDRLVEKKKEADMKKILDAYAKSKRSMEEVIDFLKGKADI